jgi:hypothetical protein
MSQPTIFENAVQEYLTASLTMLANAAVVDQAFFIAPEPLEVVEIHEIHTTLGTGAGDVTLQVERLQGTEAPGGNGDALMSATVNLKAANNTLQSPALTATTANLQLAAGDRLGVDVSGTTTSVAGVVVTVLMRRI